MGRQRNMQQMKKQGKNPPEQTNEEEIGSLPEKEFRVMMSTCHGATKPMRQSY